MRPVLLTEMQDEDLLRPLLLEVELVQPCVMCAHRSRITPRVCGECRVQRCCVTMRKTMTEPERVPEVEPERDFDHFDRLQQEASHLHIEVVDLLDVPQRSARLNV